jgi:hypothetical protein
VSQLYRVHQRLRQREFADIIKALTLQGRIYTETRPTGTKGRPPVVLFPNGGDA